jgi:hypothetical protein
MLVAAIIFLVVGSVFFAIGMLARNRTERFERAPGVITGLRHESQREYGQVAYPTVAFTLPSGERVETEAKTSAAEEDGEVAGADVTVLYDPSDPRTAEIAGPGSKALGGIFIGIGVACDALGLVLLILSAL